jgi:2-polyprenyl-6-methoxyphenol hydroxylase-like FAD-dependent oxidoreductase
MLEHAVVIGGGIAGLLAARVLADHAEQVTLLDRDRFVDEPEPRKGVPQGRHLHVFLLAGYGEATRLLPGLAPGLERAGAVPVDWARDLKLLSAYGWYPRYESGLSSLFCSRGLLEQLIRTEVGDHPRITFRTGCEVTDLLPADSGVGGVRYRIRGEDLSSAETELPAQLVVDASGRESHLPRWLATLGFRQPKETIVDAGLGYATRMYQIPGDHPVDWRYLLVRNPYPETRAGGIAAIEGGRWLVTLGGFSHDYPPHDDAGFLAFAKSLAAPEFAEAVEAAEPLGPAASFRSTVNRLRHLGRMPDWPSGFVVLGDAACTFNPIYGQGMSVATLGAVLLGRVLGEGDGAFEHTFQRRLDRLVRDPWTMATGEDYRYPQTVGPPRSRAALLSNWYGDQVLRAVVHDRRVHRAFVEVVNMLRPPSSLGRPTLASRVLRARLASSGDGAAAR